jgi:ABC-type transport system involved in multi-copper enzyme maturation permease subunit
MKICWGVFAYEFILAFVFFLVMIIIQQNSRYATDNIYSRMVWLYPILAITQLVILGIVVPVRSASAISGEKERQTFDIMMTTGMTPFSIIMGKVMTAVVQSMLYVVASLPVMALPFIIGGMPWSSLFWFLGIALLMSFFAASIGILCSSFCRKSIGAVIMSYGFYGVIFIGTFLPFTVGQIAVSSRGQNNGLREAEFLILLLNPIVYLTEFFSLIMSGDSVVRESANAAILGANSKGILKYAVSEYHWLILSTLLFLAVSFLFLWLAARKINPIKKHGKRTFARKKEPVGAVGQEGAE